MILAGPLNFRNVSEALGWPDDTTLLSPSGAGPATFAELAQNKIGRALTRFAPDVRCRIGILSANPDDDATEAPVAVLAEFETRASGEFLSELHRLSWNFSHSPALITIEPDLVRVWTCCEAPMLDTGVEQHLVHTVGAKDFKQSSLGVLQGRAAHALHWLNLVSGNFLASHSGRFDRRGRADQMLLQNLSDIRERLRKAGLTDDDISHDLLARVIFVQFLFDRRDNDGVAALDASKLAHLQAQGILSQKYNNLPSVLENYDDTYKLFDWLNTRFNGDLFAGKGMTTAQRAAGWQRERALVSPEHLKLLANFLRGDMVLASGQLCLWPFYAFDVIPLEFISSIYETFVTERASEEGIYYTPPHLVDFVLDQVMPWNSNDWNIRILDPACGSGIFLVKAFQRLVYRWKRAHPGSPISADWMRRVLTENLLGVDKDPHAVRVACFSLYLAMCDEIEPRYYWTEIHFPAMRGIRLICSDFFDEKPGFATPDTAANVSHCCYDLIVGNAPWGKNLLTARASEWSSDEKHLWAVANKDIGCLFLAKGALLLKPKGRLAMIQSAASLLFNVSDPSVRFRKKLFSTYAVDAIFNLSALRFSMFTRKQHTRKVSVSPSCVVIMRAQPPAPDTRIAYVSPKASSETVEELTVPIESSDYRWISAEAAASEPFVWTALMWGTPRDLELLRKLRRWPTLATHIAKGTALAREGVIFGDRKKSFPEVSDRRIFDANRFPSDSPVYLNTKYLPRVRDLFKDGILKTHSRSSTNFSAFASPQLLIKQGWQLEARRFQARLVQSSEPSGILCSQSYVTITGNQDVLSSACLTYNSKLANYFLQLTSGRMASYRPETAVSDLLEVPLPSKVVDLNEIRSQDDFDVQVSDAFELKDAERALIDDMIDIHVADFRSKLDRPGLRSTSASPKTLFDLGNSKEPILSEYAKYFTHVLKAGFGVEKAVQAKIFCPESSETIPFRLVSFELGRKNSEVPELINVDAPTLLAEMHATAKRYCEQNRTRQAAGLVARIYDGSAKVPTIFILKPDAVRYWTRSAALYDADEVCIDLFRMLAATAGQNLQ